MKKINFRIILLCAIITYMYNNNVYSSDTFQKYYNIADDYVQKILSIQPNKLYNDIPFFESAIPVSINAKSSFVLHAARGAGKSAVWRTKIKPELNKEYDVLILSLIHI